LQNNKNVKKLHQVSQSTHLMKFFVKKWLFYN